jgi:hypothetical protein
VLATPFLLPSRFAIGRTHGAQVICDEASLILCGDQGAATPYYAEHDGIGFCEAGHTPQMVSGDELRLFVNVVYNFSASRPRLLP